MGTGPQVWGAGPAVLLSDFCPGQGSFENLGPKEALTGMEVNETDRQGDTSGRSVPGRHREVVYRL